MIDNGRIYDIAGHDDIIYLGGKFLIVNEAGSFKNIAKYNLTSEEWLPINPLSPGPIYDLEMGQVNGTLCCNAVIYER